MSVSTYPFRVCLWMPEDCLPAQQEKAEMVFAKTLVDSLGSESIVLDIYTAYIAIVNSLGESPDLESLSDAQRVIYESWVKAEKQALENSFGTHRYMGEGTYTIEAIQ